jgi:hypothetical protein
MRGRPDGLPERGQLNFAFLQPFTRGLNLIGPEESERFKRIRVERARNFLLQVEKDYGIVPESEARVPSEQEHYDDIV